MDEHRVISHTDFIRLYEASRLEIVLHRSKENAFASIYIPLRQFAIYSNFTTNFQAQR